MATSNGTSELEHVVLVVIITIEAGSQAQALSVLQELATHPRVVAITVLSRE